MRFSKMKLKIFSVAITFLFINFWDGPAFAHAEITPEVKIAKIKTAFIYNFAKYTHWPESGADGSKMSSFVICIPKQSLFTSYFRELSARDIRGVPIYIREIILNKRESGCQMLFIPVNSEKEFELSNSYWRSQAILLVSEKPGLVDINVYPEEDKVGFDVKTVRAGKHGIQFSSQLLKLALKVIQE